MNANNNDAPAYAAKNLVKQFAHRVAYNLNALRTERGSLWGSGEWLGFRRGKLNVAKKSLRELLQAFPEHKTVAAKYFRYCFKRLSI